MTNTSSDLQSRNMNLYSLLLTIFNAPPTTNNLNIMSFGKRETDRHQTDRHELPNIHSFQALCVKNA
jgi:hypothetical protein